MRSLCWRRLKTDDFVFILQSSWRTVDVLMLMPVTDLAERWGLFQHSGTPLGSRHGSVTC